MIKFGDKSWFVLCFRPSSLLLTHTPAASSSSHRVARLAFPCVFQAVFLTQVILSPEGEIPFQGCKSSWRESPSFLPFFSACALICPLQQLQRHFMPHSALCSVPCSVECFLQLPSKIPEWNYKVVLLWRVCTACCCEYFQVPPCICPFMSGFDPSFCCKDKVCWEPVFLYWSVSEISTYTVTVELYWMCVVQDVRSPVLSTIDLRSSFFFCWSFF